MLGGLAAPRVPAQIEGGTGADVLRGEAWIRNGNGEDVTHAFVRGAEKAFEIATQVGATHACLKARSPSCGVGEVHSRAGLRPGDGVAAARLKQAGLKVCSDETLASFLREDDASESDNSR